MSKPVKITIEQVQSRATEQSYERGVEYYESGAIFDTVRRGDTLEGYCEGSQPTPYRIQVTLGAEGVVGATCTCPYDWGGDCKHIVALLLTYISEPEAFEERPPIGEALASRSREELIALIQQMVARSPELEALIDHPMPTDRPRTTPVNTDSFRRELRYAMRGYEGWGDYTAHEAVRSTADTAARFAAQGDWRSARAIYSTILDECLEDAGMFDDEGEFVGAVSEVIAALAGLLEYASAEGDDAERETILSWLLSVYLTWDWDVDVDLEETLLAHAKRADLPRFREQVQAALERAMASEYGQWQAERYARFLMQIDALDHVDPEVVLQRLREQGLYHLVFEKLLSLGRTEEAIAVVIEHLTEAHERRRAVARLADAGFGDVAIRLAEEKLQTGYDRSLVDWLLEQYTARGDKEACLRLQRQRMTAEPYIGSYTALKEAAEALGRWEHIRPEVIAWLEEKGHYDTLTRAYLHERDWDAAWATLEKAQQTGRRQHDWLGWGGQRLELEVAEQSRLTRPHKAIPVYVKFARQEIERRQRKYYQAAANYLSVARELYRRIDDEASWNALIASIRAEFKNLPALQDELNKARL